MKKKKFVPDAEPAPIRLRDGSFAASLLRGVETVEDELVAAIEDFQVSVPQDLEGKLLGMIGQQIIVGHVDGKWRAAVQNKCLREAGWRE